MSDRHRRRPAFVAAGLVAVVVALSFATTAGAQTAPPAQYVSPASTLPPAAAPGAAGGPTNPAGGEVQGTTQAAPEVEGLTQDSGASASGAGGSGSGAGGSSGSGASETLSFVSTGIPDDIDLSPSFVITNVGFGALLVLLLVAASQLFNDALKMHHDRIVGTVASRSAFVAGVMAAFRRIPRIHPLVTFAITAGALGLLANPDVSLNMDTLGQMLGMALALAVIVGVYEFPAARAIERGSGQHQPLRLFPIAMVIAVGCLLFSRIFDVAPGVLYGLFAGVLFVGVDEKLAGRAYARSSVLLGSAAMLAWGIHRLIEGAATGATPSLWAILFDTAAAVLFVGGLQSVIVQLLPMPFTYGESVISWNKVAWGSLFIGSLALYMQFVVRPNPDNVTWSNLWFVAAFLIVALGFWAFCAFRRWSDGRKAPPDGSVDAGMSSAAGA